MKLEARCEMTVEAPSPCPCVAMLRPRSGQAQWLHAERYRFEPTLHATEYVDVFGNLCQRFTLPAGRSSIAVESLVETADDIAVAPDDAPALAFDQLPDDVLQFLLQSRYCPSDKLDAKARQIAGGAAAGYAQAEAVRAWIHSHLVYRAGTSDASSDAIDTLNRGAGVCRDFAHLGIALCRALHMPTRMVVGYLHELEPMDLHAWFEAHVGGRWYTFDATQDRPRGGRIVVAYGRDAADVAFLSNYGPLEMKALHVTVDRVDDTAGS